MSELNPEFERMLKGLKPAAAGIDRDRLMFRAGQAAEQSRPRVWQSATAMLGFAVVILSVLLIRGPGVNDSAVRTIYVEAPPSAPQQVTQAKSSAADHDVAAESTDTREQPEWSYLHLQEQTLKWGLDALPLSADAGSDMPLPPVNLDRSVDVRSGREHTHPLLHMFD